MVRSQRAIRTVFQTRQEDSLEVGLPRKQELHDSRVLDDSPLLRGRRTLL